MTHIETMRLNDLIGTQIGAIQEFALALNIDKDLQEQERLVGELEAALSELKLTMGAIPHNPA